jgi:hypothetical protein
MAPPSSCGEQVGKEYHTEEQVVGHYNTGDRMKYWGKMGAFWGGIWEPAVILYRLKRVATSLSEKRPAGFCGPDSS